MIRNMLPKMAVVPLIALAAVLIGAGPRADAQTKPFKISGGGLAPQGLSLVPGVARPHTSVGTATHMGKYGGIGNYQTVMVDLAKGQASFSSAPYYTFVAANGDKLVTTYGQGGTGQATLTPGPNGTFTARFVAEFNPVPTLSTGHFKGVTGSWIMIAQSSPFTINFATGDTSPFLYCWHGEGTLTFPRKK